VPSLMVLEGSRRKLDADGDLGEKEKRRRENQKQTEKIQGMYQDTITGAGVQCTAQKEPGGGESLKKGGDQADKRYVA